LGRVSTSGKAIVGSTPTAVCLVVFYIVQESLIAACMMHVAFSVAVSLISAFMVLITLFLFVVPLVVVECCRWILLFLRRHHVMMPYNLHLVESDMNVSRSRDGV